MAKVIAGKYAGSSVVMEPEYGCLCIRYNGHNIPLDSLRVKSYTLRAGKTSIVSPSEGVYVVEWVSGNKSVVTLEKSLLKMFIAGCETAEVTDSDVDDMQRKRQRNIFTFVMVVLIIAIYIAVRSILFDDSPRNSDVVGGSTESAQQKTWAEWDGESDKPEVNMLVQTTDGQSLTSTSGVVSGCFYNTSDTTYHHLEAIYEITSENGVKRGECLFSTNEIELAPGEEQGFTATCDAWGYRPHIRLVSVGFH